MPIISKLWIHLTKPAWPVDEQFFGQNFVIAEMMKYPSDDEKHVVVNNFMPFVSMEGISKFDLLLDRHEVDVKQILPEISEFIKKNFRTNPGPDFDQLYRNYVLNLCLIKRVERLKTKTLSKAHLAALHRLYLSRSALYENLLELEHVSKSMPPEVKQRCEESLAKANELLKDRSHLLDADDLLSEVFSQVCRSLNINPEMFRRILDLEYQPVNELKQIASQKSYISDGGRGVVYGGSSDASLKSIVQSLIYENQPQKVILVYHYPKHAFRTAKAIKATEFKSGKKNRVDMEIQVYLHCLPDLQKFCSVSELAKHEAEMDRLQNQVNLLEENICNRGKEFRPLFRENESLDDGIKRMVTYDVAQALQILLGTEGFNSVYALKPELFDTKTLQTKLSDPSSIGIGKKFDPVIGILSKKAKGDTAFKEITERFRMSVSLIKNLNLWISDLASAGLNLDITFNGLEEQVTATIAALNSKMESISPFVRETRSFLENAEYVDVFTAVSKDTGEAFVNYGLFPRAKLAIKTNTVDTNTYNQKNRDKFRKELLKQFKLPDDTIVISFVGRVEEAKGYRVLISILPLIAREFKNVFYCFVGSKGDCIEPMKGSLQHMFSTDPYVKKMIEEGRFKLLLDISKYVIGVSDSNKKFAKTYFEENTESVFSIFWRTDVAGVVENNVINFPIQCASDIYLQPSRSEAIGLGLLEARESGTYIIASDSGGMPAALKGYDHRIISRIDDPIKEAETYVEAIRERLGVKVMGSASEEERKIVAFLGKMPGSEFKRIDSKISSIRGLMSFTKDRPVRLSDLANDKIVKSILDQWKAEFSEEDKKVITLVSKLSKNKELFRMLLEQKLAA
jgi:glycosyltransferase involved in cell wall biosynthesis